MKLLLDTHIWLWMINKPQKIKQPVRRLLANPRNEVYLSPVSVWEIILLARGGRLGKFKDPCPWFDQAFAASKLLEAPITQEVSLEMGRFEVAHADPADRWLIATARTYGCKLVTEDEKIIHSGCAELVVNE